MTRRFSFLVMGLLAVASSAQSQPNVKATEGKREAVLEVEIANGVKMEFHWVPAGEAQLGSPTAERQELLRLLRAKKEAEWLLAEAEETRGKFKTKGFWLGKHNVTQEQWQALMGDNPSWFSKKGGGQDQVRGQETTKHPVENVSWADCQLFLRKLNNAVKQTGTLGKGEFTLPHEDEWEYACRGGKGNKQAFYFGDELKGIRANCNGKYPYGTTTKGPFLGTTTPGGSYERQAAHPWGLCDMHGNVWNWCENWYDRKQTFRVIRGGSWVRPAASCRSAYRFGFDPRFGYRDVGCRVVFRLVMSALAADDTTTAEDALSRAIAALSKRECDNAIKYCTKAIQLQPSNAGAFAYRGCAWFFKEEYDKAIKDASEAILLDPRADWYFNRGTIYSSKKEYESAIKDFSEAIRLNPKLATAFISRGAVYARKKEYDNAVNDFNETIRLEPRFADAFVSRGCLHLEKKAYENAVKDFTETIRLAPNRANGFVGLGAAYMKIKDFDSALRDLTQAIQVDQKFADAYSTLAWLLATCPNDKFRDGKRAVELAGKSCELSEWKSPNALKALAAAHAECGEFTEAVKWQKKVIEMNVDDNELLESVGQALKAYEAGKPYREDYSR